MDLKPILDAPFAVKLHLATVVPAFAIGTWLIFFSRKGAPVHRALGAIYLTLMTVTAITTLFVHQLMPRSPFFGLSPVHLLVPLTFFAVISALWAARRHDVTGHRRAMISLYIGGMLIAGGLTLLPGRILYRAFLGG
jgi:uncharacterized membrane protein